jgi:hypothetical protein
MDKTTNSASFFINGISVYIDYDAEEVGMPKGISYKKVGVISKYLTDEGFLDRDIMKANKRKLK